MAASRKEPERLVQEVQQLLNRPDEDDLFVFPEEYFEKMSVAHRRIRGKITEHAPGLLVTTDTFTSTDGGETYELGDYHFGNLEVYAEPGPPNGERIPPASPDSAYFGFWIDGTTLHLTLARDYTLYVRWVPETISDLDAENDHTLPRFCEQMLVYETAYLLAQKRGFAGDPNEYRALSNKEWHGDPTDPSDVGILGRIKKNAAGRGYETHAGVMGAPWWKRIT